MLIREYKDPDYEPEMPPVDGAPHIIGYLFEIGPVASTGMGPGPITHQEILAWSDLTGVELHPWESRFLRRLSCEYLSTYHKAEKHDFPAPWGRVRARFSSTNMRDAIRGMAKL